MIIFIGTRMLANQNATHQIHELCRNYLTNLDQNSFILSEYNHSINNKKDIINKILRAKNTQVIASILNTPYSLKQTNRDMLQHSGNTWGELLSYSMTSLQNMLFNAANAIPLMAWIYIVILAPVIINIIITLLAFPCILMGIALTATVYGLSDQTIFETEGMKLVKQIDKTLSSIAHQPTEKPWEAFDLSFNSAEEWLHAIINDPNIANIRSSNGDTLLHALVKCEFTDPKIILQIRQAVKHLQKQYDIRNDANETPLFILNKIDPYELTSLLQIPVMIDINNELNKIDAFFENVQLDPQKNNRFLLLEGPSGVGKSHTVFEYLAKKGHTIHEWTAGTQDDKWRGALEERVIDFFSKAISAAKQGPKDKFHILFIDHINSTCPQERDKNNYLGPDHHKISELFHTQVQALKRTNMPHNIVLVGTSNMPQNISLPLLMSATRVLFTLPNALQREKLLNHFFVNKAISDEHIKRTAQLSVCWSPHSLLTLATEISEDIVTEQRLEQAFKQSATIIENDFRIKNPNAQITLPHFTTRTTQNPLSFLPATPTEVCECFNELADFLTYPTCYNQIPMHVLLEGPPGGGKTTAARIFAEHANIPFIYAETGISITELQSLFKTANDFGQALIFIDEIDKIMGMHSPYREMLQEQMNGLTHNNTIIIGATNYPERIARALLERFKFVVNVPSLNNVERGKLITTIIREELAIKPTLITDQTFSQELQENCPKLSVASDKLSIRAIKWEIQGLFGKQRVQAMKHPNTTNELKIDQFEKNLQTKAAKLNKDNLVSNDSSSTQSRIFTELTEQYLGRSNL